MLGPITHRIATAVAGAAAIAALAPGLAWAGTWLPATQLRQDDTVAPSVAIDGAGDTVAVWQRRNLGLPATIEGAHHPVGASLFTQLPAFSADPTPTHDNLDPLVVTDRAGDGLVVWVNFLGGSAYQLQLRTIGLDGTVGSIVSEPSVASISNPTAAIDANGDAVVAWEQGGNIEAITRQGKGGTFSAPQTINGAMSQAPTAAIDGSGDAIVAWTEGTEISAAVAPHGSPFGAEHSVSTVGHTYANPAIAANPNGQMVLAFTDLSGADTVISAVTSTVGDGLVGVTVHALSGTGINKGPKVTVDAAGDAAVGWTTNSQVQVSERPAGGVFPSPAGEQSVTPVPVMPGSFAMAGSGSGEIVVAWSSFEPSFNQNVVRAAVKPAGSSAFGASQEVSDTSVYSANPVAAVDQNGDVVLAFPLGAGSPSLGIGSAVFDGAGPLLGTPTGPATATVGTAGQFSVPQPSDAFSNVASVSWSFGDGSAPASGAAVSHTFTKTGTFTVTVTATDAVGNASSATLHVTVTGGNQTPKCVVPKLKGKSLSKAKSLLRKAHCALGKVHKPKPRKHHKIGKLVVKSSSPKAGSSRPAGTKVNLTLTKAPKKHK